jgi:AraC family transcriptional regulator
MGDETARLVPRGAQRPGGSKFYGQVTQQRRIPGLRLSVLEHQSARVFPAHAHERAYVCLLLDGSYCEEFARHSLQHRSMSLSIHPAGMEHRDSVGARGGRFFILEIEDGRLSPTAGPSGALLGPSLLPGVEALGQVLRLYREFLRWDHCSAPIAESLFSELVGGLDPGFRHGERPPAWLGRVEEMVRARFRENLPLATLAAAAGVHPVHLSRTFRRFLGKTPGELARELRVRRVCEGLADRHRPLADLALEAGFSDQAHMTRIFARQTGMTPAMLRGALGPAARSARRQRP